MKIHIGIKIISTNVKNGTILTRIIVLFLFLTPAAQCFVNVRRCKQFSFVSKDQEKKTSFFVIAEYKEKNNMVFNTLLRWHTRIIATNSWWFLNELHRRRRNQRKIINDKEDEYEYFFPFRSNKILIDVFNRRKDYLRPNKWIIYAIEWTIWFEKCRKRRGEILLFDFYRELCWFI